MSAIERIGSVVYNTLVKDPVEFWTGKNESEGIGVKDVAKAYGIGMSFPLWFLSCNVRDEGYVRDLGSGGTAGEGAERGESVVGSEGRGEGAGEGAIEEVITPIVPDLPSIVPDLPSIVPDLPSIEVEKNKAGGGSVVNVSHDFLIHVWGAKVQSGRPIETPPITYGESVAAGKVIKIYFESVPLHVFQKLADNYGDGTIPKRILDNVDKIDGLIDFIPVPYNPFEDAQQVNVGTKENPYYIKDPTIATNRLPVFMGKIEFSDLTENTIGYPEYVCKANGFMQEDCGEESETVIMQVCSHDEAYDHKCDSFRIGPNQSEVYPPFEFTVPKQAYADNLAKFIERSILTVHAENFDEGHDYIFAGRIRLVIE